MQQDRAHEDRDLVLRELRRVLDEARVRAVAAGADLDELWSLMVEGILGGKLVRPRMLLAVHDALTVSAPAPRQRADRTEVVRLAAAVELLHAAFLLHDDVIDGDVRRRGRENLIGALVARSEHAGARGREHALHWGRSAAILMGDLLLTTSHLLFARAEVPPPARRALLDLLEETTTVTVAGEVLDVRLADRERKADLPTVLEMTAAKTAAYTVQLPLRMAAVLAGRPDLEDPLDRVGRHLGLAYQLQDDLLSAFGHPRDHGKDPLSDLREGKQTALVMIASERPGWSEVSAALGRADLTAATAEPLREHLRTSGARTEVEGMVEREMGEAQRILREHDGMPAGVRGVLAELITGLEHRVS